MEKIFVSFAGEIDTWRQRCDKAYRGYRAEKSRISERYAEKIAAEKLDRLRTDTRAELATADLCLKIAAGIFADELNGIILQQLQPGKSEKQLAGLRVLRDFGIRLSEQELRILLRDCDSYVSQRALATIAEQSGFRMKIPALDVFAKDVDAVRGRFHEGMLYAPEGYDAEACEIYPSRPFFAADGSVYSWADQTDAVYFGLNRAAADGAADFLADMLARWNGSFTPEITPIHPETATDAEIKAHAEAELQRQAAIEAHAENVHIEQLDASPAGTAGGNDTRNAVAAYI